MLACMVGPTNTGQQIAPYLLPFCPIPTYIIIFRLYFLTYPTKNLATMILKTAPWRLWGNTCVVRCKRVNQYKKPVRDHKKTRQQAKSSGLTYFQQFLSPSRLVVALRFSSSVSCVPPSGTLASWLSKAKQCTNQHHRQSDSIPTCIQSGLTTPHQYAWPMPHISLKTFISTATKDEWMG
jgi:hypothetical protein